MDFKNKNEDEENKAQKPLKVFLKSKSQCQKTLGKGSLGQRK